MNSKPEELDPDEVAIREFVARFRADNPDLYDKPSETDPAAAKSREEGRLNGEEEEFLHGKCHLLAVALHELTGLPMGAYLDEATVERNGEDLELIVLVHAFVVDGDEAIDIRGRVPLEEVVDDEFEFFEPWFVNPTAEDLFSLGEGRRKVSRKNPRYLEALKHAERLVERLQLRRPEGPSAP